MNTDLIAVLVVEDEPLLQDLLQESLTEAGFQPEICTTGEEAISMLDKVQTEFRALITDITLGGKLTGWDVAKHARQAKPDIPVIYTSGKDAEDWPSMGVPNSLMLSKPFAPAQVVTAVAQLLNNTPPIAPH